MDKNNFQANINFCDWCGMPAKIIWVHGHGQCSNCGINIEECCKGETCEKPDDDSKDNSDSDNEN